MRLAVSSYSFWRWMRENARTLDDAVAQAAELGFEGIEFAGGVESIERAIQLKELAKKVGVAIPSYCVGAELLCGLEEQRKVVEQLKKDIDIAAALGAKTFRHDVTRGFNEQSHQLGLTATVGNAIKIVRSAVREVADYAATKGIKSSLENHGFFMQASTRVEQLIKAVAHPNFGLTIDCGNFLCVNENPVRAVKRLAKYAIMAHAKDFHVRPKTALPPTGWFATPTKIGLRGAIVGHGVIDIPAELKLLKDAGYDGWLSLEFEGMEEPLSAIKLGREYLKKTLESLETNPLSL